MCAQSSQRATWPPSAAVRQLSIADITLSWPRLTWPALALTPRRSMVAEDVRDLQRWTGHGTAALRRAARSSSSLQREALERAHDLADRVGGDVGVERRGVELGVPEQDLDHADVDVLLEQMGGEAVPQRVQRHALVDPGHLRGGMAGAVELARRDRLHRIAARETASPAVARCRHQARSSSSSCGESIA